MSKKTLPFPTKVDVKYPIEIDSRGNVGSATWPSTLLQQKTKELRRVEAKLRMGSASRPQVRLVGKATILTVDLSDEASDLSQTFHMMDELLEKQRGVLSSSNSKLRITDAQKAILDLRTGMDKLLLQAKKTIQAMDDKLLEALEDFDRNMSLRGKLIWDNLTVYPQMGEGTLSTKKPDMFPQSVWESRLRENGYL